MLEKKNALQFTRKPCQKHKDNRAPVICLHDIAVSYQNALALYDVNLEIYEGEFIGILGPNGSGKTTLLKTMLGVKKPIHGEIHVVGEDEGSYNRKEFLQKVGYVPQKTNIDSNFPALVKDVVAMGLYSRKGLFGFYTKKDYDDVLEALRTVGMEDFADRPIGHLSGGQQQKVLIARALVNKPSILLLDEPTANLDFKVARSVVNVVKELQEKKGLTVVLVTHNLEFLKKYSTRVIVLQKYVIWTGPPTDPELDQIVLKVFAQA